MLLYRSAAMETGGVLSHAATVAREFGIAAVVAVKGATRLITTGQRVTVDGMTGAVTLD
jgi:rifampicin phosphotransferase